MVVYWEYAFAENFLLDWCLLYLALLTARGKMNYLRLTFSAALGGAEGVLFPLVKLPIAALYAVKILGGVLLVFVAHSGRWKSLLIATFSFFGYTFALGGLIVAAYSFFQIEYRIEQGYLLEGAPVGLILGGGGTFTILLRITIKHAFHFRKVQSLCIDCTLKNGVQTCRAKGLVDSGNLLRFRGEPVSVISPTLALALFGKNQSFEGTMSVTTVHGTRPCPLLRCEKAELGIGQGITREGALFAVADVGSREFQMILHTAWTEEEYGNFHQTKIAVAKDKRK